MWSQEILKILYTYIYLLSRLFRLLCCFSISMSYLIKLFSLFYVGYYFGTIDISSMKHCSHKLRQWWYSFLIDPPCRFDWYKFGRSPGTVFLRFLSMYSRLIFTFALGKTLLKFLWAVNVVILCFFNVFLYDPWFLSRRIGFCYCFFFATISLFWVLLVWVLALCWCRKIRSKVVLILISPFLVSGCGCLLIFGIFGIVWSESFWPFGGGQSSGVIWHSFISSYGLSFCR